MDLSTQKRYIAHNFLSIPIKRMAKDIGRSQTFVRAEMDRQGLVVPKHIIEKRKRASQFKKGNISFNKGKNQTEFMSPEAIERSKKTLFKKGNLPHNTRKDFDISKRIDGKGYSYYYIRIAKAKWVLLHRFLWEQHNGTIPKGCNVQFKDGNTLNCNIENLHLINKKDQVRVNKKGGIKLPFEQRVSVELISKIKRKIKEYEKHTK